MVWNKEYKEDLKKWVHLMTAVELAIVGANKLLLKHEKENTPEDIPLEVIGMMASTVTSIDERIGFAKSFLRLNFLQQVVKKE